MMEVNDLTAGDRLVWMDKQVTVLDVGTHLSDVTGTHIEIQSPSDPSLTDVVHGRLINRWLNDDTKRFGPANQYYIPEAK